MLRGEKAERYERNELFRSYTKTPVYMNNGSDINLNSFHVQIKDFLKSLHFTTEGSMNDYIATNYNDWNATKELPMHLSFQAADRTCFSRNTNDDLNTVRLNDLITIDSTVVRLYEETEMEIFVHYPNQLLTSFEKAKYSTTFSHLISILSNTTPKVLEFKLTECKRIKKRHDSNEPCNQNIQNYDQYLEQRIRERLMRNIGCVPIYLKPDLLNYTELRECTSAKDLQEANEIMHNIKAIVEESEHPCDEMLILSIDSINNNPSPIPDDIAIQFYYTENVYEEIQYIRAIGFGNWLSNVGGFVGIFLGYSMMQFPEFLLLFATTFNSKGKNTWSGMSSLIIDVSL